MKNKLISSEEIKHVTVVKLFTVSFFFNWAYCILVCLLHFSVLYGSISGGIIGGVLTLLGIIYIIMKMCHHHHRNKVYSQDKQQPRK